MERNELTQSTWGVEKKEKPKIKILYCGACQAPIALYNKVPREILESIIEEAVIGDSEWLPND